MGMKRMEIECENPRYVDVAGLMAYACVGRSTALQLGIDANAKIKVGKRTIYDLTFIDAYLNKHRIKSISAADNQQSESVKPVSPYEERILAEIDRIEGEIQAIRDVLKESDYFCGGNE